MLTNYHLGRYATQVARRASSWAHDTMTMGEDYRDQPTINDSAERFCKEIEDVLSWIRADAGSEVPR